MTEQEMRSAKVPWPKTIEELTAYIQTLIDQPHDYGTCVYAMSMAATAAYNHVASVLGTTGFQASCADLDILRRTRHMDHGFQVIDYDNMLYPQYWDEKRGPLYRAILLDEETREQVQAAAQARLAEGGGMHDAVRAHLEKLAAGQPV